MANLPTKRSKKEVGNALKQKVQDLPLLCVEAICKFTPTSRLIRLYSTAVPLPGASWNFGLEAALKRRKISISKDSSSDEDYYYDRRSDALFDSSGAKVATIKHPEAFHLSPLCEFVQTAAVPFRVLPSYAAAEPHLSYVISGPPLLRHMPNVSKLTLVNLGALFEKPSPAKTLDVKDYLVPILEKVLSQLESFAFKSNQSRKMLDVTLVEMLPEMAILKRLDVPSVTFGRLMRAATAGSEGSAALWRTLSGLSSIRLRQGWGQGCPPALNVQLLSFMSGCCTHLTQLSLTARGGLKRYLVALREMASLTVLGLELRNVNTKGMTFDEGEVVSSVSDLRLAHHLASLRPHVIGAVASLFPNVKTAALHDETLAAELCEKAVWPKLEKLCCFFPCYQTIPSLAQFLGSPNLPSFVDLSPIIEADLSHDSSTLTSIYQAVQSGPIKTLLLRGPLHREALPRLQAYTDFCGESAKVTAWKAQDLDEQTTMIINDGHADVPATEFSELSDVRIVGTKETGGNFTIRVVHQHTKKTNIFD